MANLIKLSPGVRTLDQGLFSSHTGNVYVMPLYGEDGGQEIWIILAATPTAANFNAAPVGSILIDTDDFGSWQVHNAATTWETFTIS
jgi:hypothetical protein